jgi:hypothetical protein
MQFLDKFRAIYPGQPRFAEIMVQVLVYADLLNNQILNEPGIGIQIFPGGDFFQS